jgi:hypothetical protein
MIGKTGSVRASCLGIAALLVWAVSGAPSWGSEIPVTLSDQNSTIQVYSQSDVGIGSWTVDGVSQLNRQSFWFRVGDASPANPEQSIDTLTRTFSNPLDGNGDGNYDYLNQKFVQSGQFSVALTYTLTGGEIGSGNSDLGMSIKIVNTSSQSLKFHFFQLSDFDLGGSGAQDTAQAGKNLSGLCDEVLQQNGNWSVDTVITPGASQAQVDFHPSIYNLLTNSQGDDLNGAAGPVGPGNVEWGFEWTVTLAPNANLTISEDQSFTEQTPEPTSITLLVIGAIGLLRNRRKYC